MIYKIISKTLANRRKGFLVDIILINQSDIILGRSITDNALLAFEAFHSMEKKADGRNNSFTLKLGMSKAYDRVEWGILEWVMLRLSFNEC